MDSLQGPLQREVLVANTQAQATRQAQLPLENTMQATTTSADNFARKPRKPRNMLNAVQTARLINLIEAEYVSSDKNDAEFAAYAADKIGREITEHNVQYMRVQLGMKSRTDRIAEQNATKKKLSRGVDIDALLALVKTLEDRVVALEAKVSRQ